MMQIKTFTNPTSALILASTLLVGFAIVLVTLTLYGQKQLHASLDREFELQLHNHTRIIDYFFSIEKKRMEKLSHESAISTYFVNQSLGMSMQYGLHSTLLKMRQRIKKFQGDTTILKHSTYLNVIFLDDNNTLLTSAKTPTKEMQSLLEKITYREDEPVLSVQKLNGISYLVMLQGVYYQEEYKGTLVAPIDLESVVKELLAFNENTSKYLALESADGSFIIHGSKTLDDKKKSFTLHSIPFTLEGVMKSYSNTSLLTTQWFQWSLITVSLGIMLGVFFLMRTHSRNLILRTQIEFSLKRQKELNDKNKQLSLEIAKRMQSEEDLYRLAHYDPLTQLPNRLLFIDRLKQMIELSKRHNSQCAVLFIDLDHFKMINDSLGHTFGDEVLKIIADRLKESLRTSDTVARLGGDEFIVIITDIKENSDIVSIIEQIIANVSEPIFIEDQKLHSTLSIGASLYPNDGENVDILLRNADAAMYKAKSIGRNTYQFYTSDITAEVYEHLTMETQLRQALKNNELTLYYQPQIDANRSIVTGYEALIRWNHHEMGMISPAKFIPLAEKSDLIIALGAFVLQQACQQAVVWNHKTERSHHVSINISMRQLQQSSFTQQVKDILAHTHCLPQWIEFEVTEGYVMHNPKQAIKTLQSIHDLGIKIAVDDFGTGYSSLIYLKRLPIDTLKIDQSFVRDLLTDADDRAITQTIISLAQNMGLGIIAEGVEEYAQQEFLLAHKCHDIQGFYYSAALPADEAEAWTRQFEMQSSCI